MASVLAKEAVLALPTTERGITRKVSVRFGDLVKWLMPNGRYVRANWPAIQRALHRVHNLRLPWERTVNLFRRETSRHAFHGAGAGRRLALYRLHRR